MERIFSRGNFLTTFRDHWYFSKWNFACLYTLKVLFSVKTKTAELGLTLVNLTLL